MPQFDVFIFKGTIDVATQLSPDVQQTLKLIKAFMRGATPIPFEIEREVPAVGHFNMRLWNTSKESLRGNVFTYEVALHSTMRYEGQPEEGQEEVVELEDSSQYELEQVVAQLDLEEDEEEEGVDGSQARVVEMVNLLLWEVCELAHKDGPKTKFAGVVVGDH